MPRIIRDLFIPHANASCTLELHIAAKLLGFAALPEVSTNFAVSWWLDDADLDSIAIPVLIVFTGASLDELPGYVHLASCLPSPHNRHYPQDRGLHLLGIAEAPSA